MNLLNRIPISWLLRLYLALSILVSAYISLSEPLSLMHFAISRAGFPGWPCVFALVGLTVLTLPDIVINDLLPKRFTLHLIRNNRHIIYMLLALGLMSITFVLVRANGYTPLIWRYVLESVMAATIAFSDLFARHRRPE